MEQNQMFDKLCDLLKVRSMFLKTQQDVVHFQEEMMFCKFKTINKMFLITAKFCQLTEPKYIIG